MASTETLDCGHSPDPGRPATILQNDGTTKVVQGWTFVRTDDDRKICHACAAKAAETTILDCGHVESPHSDITRGYGTDSAGKRHCYACCQKADLATMAETGRIAAYLSSDGKSITNWPGLPLMHVTAEWETSAGGFARRTQITRVRATAADGSKWYGRGPGRGMYIRMHRAARPRSGR